MVFRRKCGRWLCSRTIGCTFSRARRMTRGMTRGMIRGMTRGFTRIAIVRGTSGQHLLARAAGKSFFTHTKRPANSIDTSSTVLTCVR